MQKTEFLKKWAKRACYDQAVEVFERDVETLIRSVVRISASGVVNGMIEGLKSAPKEDRERLTKIIQEISPAVERALKRLYE